MRELQTQITEKVGNVAGKKIFSGLPVPEPGAPPVIALEYTRELTTRTVHTFGVEKASAILAVNAHAIPAEVFEKDKRRFKEIGSLSAFHIDLHIRNIETLQRHADDGTPWFEQEISQEVVDFVKEHQEILGGVLRNGKIYITKIPYKPAAWLQSDDLKERRYLTCHCPMAREALHPGRESGKVKTAKGEALYSGNHQSNQGPSQIPPQWCSCSAGFAAQRFHAIFNQQVECEVVESVLAGDDRCRFAITVPEEFL